MGFFFSTTSFYYLFFFYIHSLHMRSDQGTNRTRARSIFFVAQFLNIIYFYDMFFLFHHVCMLWRQCTTNARSRTNMHRGQRAYGDGYTHACFILCEIRPQCEWNNCKCMFEYLLLLTSGIPNTLTEWDAVRSICYVVVALFCLISTSTCSEDTTIARPRSLIFVACKYCVLHGKRMTSYHHSHIWTRIGDTARS